MSLQDTDSIRQRVLEGTVGGAPETIAVADAVGRVLAQDVIAPADLPATARAAMDGFAVCSADLAGASRVTLEVIGAAMAGGPRAPVGRPGTACQIATGAVVPTGYDTVVRIEETVVDGPRVSVPATVTPGRDVRTAGEDARAGDTLALAQARLTPVRVAGLLGASVGVVTVWRQPRVAIIPTGDEIACGQVPDALTGSLSSLVERWGGQASLCEPVADERQVLRSAVADALADHDVVVTTGGASVGPRDHAGAVAESLGGHRVQLALRPGRPFAYANTPDGQVLCLPGSPIAALAVATLLVQPVVRMLSAGVGLVDAREMPLAAGSDFDASPVRRMVPARIGDSAAAVPGNGAADVARLARSDGFIEIPPGRSVTPGQTVIVHGS